MSLDLSTRIVTTTPYTVVDNDTVIFVNVNGPSSIVLPSNGIPNSPLVISGDLNCKEYQSFYIKDFSGNSKTNPITITSAGSKTIDGVSFAIINSGYAHIQVVYDGTNWKIIS